MSNAQTVAPSELSTAELDQVAGGIVILDPFTHRFPRIPMILPPRGPLPDPPPTVPSLPPFLSKLSPSL